MQNATRTRKIAALCFVVMFACTAILFPNMKADAGSIQSYGSTFSAAWERYATGDGGRAGLTYGYNTTLVNEDYAWAKHSTQSHYAAVYNGTGWHTGKGVNAGSTSKIEVTHSGTAVKYYCYY